ncbi:MAG: Rieske (2Fe-2S) protein [Actinobacteria bacterium]|jgi:ubiquinol-cytochrome c reductase iron-sulfur subunit|nr:Rieske (2Fe-2S) protein [Micrococcales bacterium]MCB0903050.1 Rieske (2Fe-2S) protein [Actinomycetota bacterium]MCO5300499.1 Rieske (2Fe-2S) protein [Candidatus Nanopelagicales bacterium]MCB9428875.1 Rieske (2Fe-2S) protein [Actinomycetota bacterium]HPE13933.1 Rieske 2Fe-2S domain-containing protein [Actinomycetota bacterium]
MTTHENLPATTESAEAAAIEKAAAALPAHRPRRTDVDPKAARRAERQVAAMFLGSALMTVLFVVAFVAIPVDETVYIWGFGTVNASNIALGVTFGLAILLIGTGAIHWSKKLMNEKEEIQLRHPLASSDEEREAAVEAFQTYQADSGFTQRPIIRRSLLTAMVLFPIPMVVLLRDLGPLPGEVLRETLWEPGSRIVIDPTGRPVRPSDLALGGLISAMPADLPEVQEEEGNLNARAKAAIILVRMEPQEIVSQQGDNWDYGGILAFSKICTHVGCPIALYEQRTHHLLCPCHQSTFDLADSGNVVFGPAARRLPQLPITIDPEGFLVAVDGFAEPVGPSFWERGDA